MDKLTLDKLISQILGEPDDPGSGQVYCDEPIIRRASEIKKPKVPAKIREMRNIARTREAYWKTSAWLFYQQGTFMAEYTDDYDYSGYNKKFFMFMPAYSEMDTEQLRGYFSWRTRFRNGEFTPVPNYFIALYAQEIINRIGVSSAEEGFELLARLQQEYPDCPDITENWLSDYAVYYGLPEEYYTRCSEFENDRYITAFINFDETDDDLLYKAVCELSPYKIGSSKFCREYPQEYKQAIVRVVRSLSSFHEKHRKRSLCEALFGKMTERFYRMFEYAAFYEKERHKEVDITVNPVRSYRCRGNGIWSVRRYEKTQASRKLGMIAKETDRLMREAYGFKGALKESDVPKSTVDLIKKVIDAISAEREKASAREKLRKIVIDVSQLSRIRADADIVRDKLIVEEEAEQFPESAEEIVRTKEEETPVEESGGLLTAAENGFVQALLSGADVRAYAAGTGVLPSVLGDGINEKLFDIFADNVIDFTGDKPCILEDYIDDIKQMSENGEL